MFDVCVYWVYWGLFNKLCQFIIFVLLRETDEGTAGVQPTKGYLNRLECQKCAAKSSAFLV